MHHIIADGWSLGVLVRELMLLYQAHTTGGVAALSTLPIQYADYAAWQRAWLQGPALEAQVDYWRAHLRGAPVALDLPLDHPRPPLQTFRGALQPFALPLELTAALADLSRREGVTLFMTLLAGFLTLLQRYTSQDDLVVGTRIAGRNRRETEALVGFFINALALRTDLSGNPSFRELLGRVRAVALGAYTHQDVPFELLVEELRPQRDPSRHPLFQVMFVLQNYPIAELELPGLSVQPFEIAPETVKYDLDFSLYETTDGLKGTLEYNIALFAPDTISRILRQYEMVLGSVVADPSLRLSEVPLLTEAERRCVLEDWNATRQDYSYATGLHSLFAAQAARTPHAVAVSDDDQQLTYAQLDRRANRLAHHLQALGVGPEVPVGVFIERSSMTFIALLSIIKAGGVYVPLDPRYPATHLAFMLADTGVPVVLTYRRLVDQLPRHQATIVCLDADRDQIAGRPVTDPINRATPSNLSHIMYTSGSTGQPKGVAVEQRQLLNRLPWMWEAYPFGADEVVCQRTTANFSVSLWEMLGPLLQGVPTVVATDDIVQDAERFIALLAARQVTRIVLVPSLLRMILDSNADLQRHLTRLQLWSICGERLAPELYMRFRERLPQATLLHQYGASEVNDVTCYDTSDYCGNCVSVPIGRPIGNMQVYLLDERLQPVAPGMTGEVYIGGPGLARGYLNRPDLTAERFIPNPFLRMEDGGWRMEGVPSSILHPPSSRLYRMGDLARHLPDGRIEHIGRRDHQVKVRGIRIELGGIEALLAQHPAVHQAVVTARAGADGEIYAVAYVIAGDWRVEIGDSTPDNLQSPISNLHQELRGFLKERLLELDDPGRVRGVGRAPINAERQDRPPGVTRTGARPDDANHGLRGPAHAG